MKKYVPIHSKLARAWSLRASKRDDDRDDSKSAKELAPTRKSAHCGDRLEALQA